MKVQVKVIGYFIYQTGFSEKEMDLPDSSTAGELLSLINIKRRLPRIMMINGKGIGPDKKLKDGDRIVIAPLAGGG
jgi:molybdopterin converting factor small subunit